MNQTQEEKFLELARAGRNLFLTGMAGTGKSFTLRSFIAENEPDSEAPMFVRALQKKIGITAPTGIAALNIGGYTVNRWCGMLLGPQRGQTDSEYAFELEGNTNPALFAGWQRARRCSVLIIDEISMLPGRTLTFLDFWLKRLRKDERPFGGLQIIVVGDFLQLPPVRIGGGPYDWAFKSPAWASAQFEQVTLTTVRRQDEPEWVQALGEFRMGRIVGATANLLFKQVRAHPPEDLTRIYSRNSQVDRWNENMLAGLPDHEMVYEAITSGSSQQIEFLTKNLLTPQTLRLRIGAKVMFTRNDRKGAYVNGTMGNVIDLQHDSAVVVVGESDMITVERSKWSSNPDGHGGATFEQLPLRLAYAMTIHKSQGQTLDGAYVDINSASEDGQAYVAVSRVRKLAGLWLKSWPKWVRVNPEAMAFYESHS